MREVEAEAVEETSIEEEEGAEDTKISAKPPLSVTNAIRLAIFSMNVLLRTRRLTMPNWIRKKNYS